jgi:hypothetical protein
MGTGAVSPEVKRQGREADHSTASTADVKSGGTIPPLHPICLYSMVFNYNN